MRIVLTGAHDTGKTTLARFLSRKLSIPYITDNGRDYLETFFGTDNWKRLTPVEHVLFSSIRAVSITYAHMNNTQFITDRSPLDTLAYLHLSKVENHYTSEIQSFIEKLEFLLNTVLSTEMYNLVIHLTVDRERYKAKSEAYQLVAQYLKSKSIILDKNELPVEINWKEVTFDKIVDFVLVKKPRYATLNDIEEILAEIETFKSDKESEYRDFQAYNHCIANYEHMRTKLIVDQYISERLAKLQAETIMVSLEKPNVHQFYEELVNIMPELAIADYEPDIDNDLDDRY